MKISYNWLGEMVPITLRPRELAERMTMIGFAVDSVEPFDGDYVLDFDLTSNRPDCLSHFGLAREAALLCGATLKALDSFVPEADQPVELAATVRIADPIGCPRYSARVVRGVKVGPSPAWLARRLEAVGQRPVNNIADITNYVMFEMGQPTHAFDLGKLRGGKIVVRPAAEGEPLTTLDGFERELSPDVLVIADARRAVAIAGVIGGEDSEISDTTVDVLVESAYFNPAGVRAAVRKLGLDTEASYRFSRGVDFEAQPLAAARVARLVQEIAGGTVLKGVLDAYPAPVQRDRVRLRSGRVKEITGLDVSIQRAEAILSGLGFKIEGESAASLEAIPPSFRHDVSREIDLVEEVARHRGYDLIDQTLPAWTGAGAFLAGESNRKTLRQTLVSLGFDEAISLSFIDGAVDSLFSLNGGPVLNNPIDVTQNQMRSSLLGGLIGAVRHNSNHGRRDVKLFEMGRVFLPPPPDTVVDACNSRPDEKEMLALVAAGDVSSDDWKARRETDFYDVKGVVESLFAAAGVSVFTIEQCCVEYLHPGQSALLRFEDQILARFGKLHPRIAGQFKLRQPVFVAEIELNTLLELENSRGLYSPLSRHPATSRDISALFPDTVLWSDIERAIIGLGIGEIAGIRVFDVYSGKGVPENMKSLAFRVTFGASDRTLTDDEVSGMHAEIGNHLMSAFGAQLR